MKDSLKISTDIKLVRQFLRIGEFVGTVPYYSSPTSFIKKCLSQLYVSLLTVLFTTVFVVSVLDRKKLYMEMKLIYIIVDFLVLLVNFLLILSCRITAVVKIKQFSLLDETLLSIEDYLSSLDFKVKKWNSIRQFLKVFFLHFLFSIIHVLEIINRLNNENNTIYFLIFLPHVLGLYHQLFVIYLITTLNRAIEIRYNFLQENLECNVNRKQRDVETFVMTGKILSLDQVLDICRLIFKLSNIINDIFGMQIFFILSRTVLETLTIINLMKSDLKWSELGVDLAYGFTFIISTILIVKSCDNVVNSAMDILLTCYTNQESLTGTIMEKKLLRFAKINKHLIPRYSAGGFADINQKLLSALFSATLTYLIVIIQFDLSSKT